MKKVIAGNLVTFTFDGLDAVVFDATKASATNRAYAEMHGWQARIGDNAALSRKDKDGNVITITEQMRRDAVAELVGHYESGAEAWAVRGAAQVKQNPVIAAVAAKKGITYAEAEALVAAQFLDDME